MIRNFFSKLNHIQLARGRNTHTLNLQKFNFWSKKSEKIEEPTHTEILPEFEINSTTSYDQSQITDHSKINIDGIPVSAEDILRNRYKVIIKNSSVSQEALSHLDTKSIIQQYSSLFSNWLIQRVKEGKGTHFEFEELPEEIQSKLSTLREVYEQKEKFVPLDKSEYSRHYQEKINQKGYITNQDLNEIENIQPFIHRSKDQYNDPIDAIREIKKFSKEKSLSDSIIKLQLVMNLDFDRADHFIQTLLKLPFESKALNDICVITSDENHQQAISLGAAASITAPKLASLLEEKLFSHKKIICTEDQYVDLLDYCSDNIKAQGLEVPMRELGTVLKVEDLPTAIKFIQSGSVNLRPVKMQSQFVVSGFDKIIDIDIADTSMSEKEIVANVDVVLRKLSEMQPKSILGRYFLSGIMIVKNKAFVIQAKTLDAKYDSYFIQGEEKVVKKKEKRGDVKDAKSSKDGKENKQKLEKNKKDVKNEENKKTEKKQSVKASK
jgi:ribosomal protein L1